MNSSVRCLVICQIVVGILFSCKKADTPVKEDVITDFDTLSGVKGVKIADQYDVVIYGGTSSGIIAALELAKAGKSVVIINPRGSGLGGMTTNGLGSTDFGDPKIIGGLAGDFYKDMKREYLNPLSWIYTHPQDYSRLYSYGDKMFFFEPKVAQGIFRKYILKYNIPIIQSDRLDLNSGVVKSRSRTDIISIKLESGKTIKGIIFIDASYEGDLMAKAGVSYTVGRESSSTYGENLNGINRNSTPTAQFYRGVSDDYKILKNETQVGQNGLADKKVQAYGYRLPLTNVPVNRVDITKPSDYDVKDYDFLFQYLKIKPNIQYLDLYPLPNGKTDTNNSGPMSIDYVGGNYDYPDGSYEVRDRIIRKHRSYVQGFLWTLSNHPDVPAEVRKYYKEWGLSKDEFVDNKNWPYQLYVREARRMVSDFVMTQSDCEGATNLGKSIGRALYSFDSHVVQRYVAFDGNVKNEGGFHKVLNTPYTLSYGLIVPKKSQCTNLFVSVCVSASHVAFSSLRMEPIYMVLGQSAACAAIIALDRKVAVQDVSYDELRTNLLKRGIVL